MNRLLLPGHLYYADTDFDIRLFYSIFAIHILNEGGDYEKLGCFIRCRNECGERYQYFS